MKNILLLLACIPLFAIGQTSVTSTIEVEDKIKFVSDYAFITSFDEVLQRFEGRTVYIDLWATWCGPCIGEFEHKEGLNAFKEENDIDVLYISIDQDNADLEWKESIEKYQLSGYHMRATKELTREMQERFTVEMEGGEFMFGIPHYLIAKDGQIVLEDAPRPSSGDLLYDELKKHL